MKRVLLILILVVGYSVGETPKLEKPESISDTVTLSADMKIAESALFSNRCIETLGCFYTGGDFYDPIQRPISLSPQDPENEFRLYTRKNRKTPYNLTIDSESLKNSPFNPNLKTMFIIHGFLTSLKDPDNSINKMKNALLRQGRYNVFIVDWTTQNVPPYSQAASTTRSQGALVAKLINFLIETAGITPQSIHMIGHSLGAHISGYVGKRIPNIGRITGLDPAGPFFQGLKPPVHLNQNDAFFVDVIHTNGAETVLTGFGTIDPLGDIDFYPNGGSKQPGCPRNIGDEGMEGASVNFTQQFINFGCDHSRAVDLFTESVNDRKCKFMAVQCTSYEDFENGQCPPDNTTINEMGLHVIQMPDLPQPAKFFLRTDGSSPYCIEDSILL